MFGFRSSIRSPSSPDRTAAASRGILDVLNVELGLLHGDVVIGRNTGRDEFPGHVRTLAKFDKLSGFILVLDGDSRALEDRLQAVADRKSVV